MCCKLCKREKELMGKRREEGRGGEGRKKWGRVSGELKLLDVYSRSSNRKSLVKEIKWSVLDLSAHPSGRAEGETWKNIHVPSSQESRGQNGDRSKATATQLTAGCKLDQRLRTPPTLRRSEASSCVSVKFWSSRLWRHSACARGCMQTTLTLERHQCFF